MAASRSRSPKSAPKKQRGWFFKLVRFGLICGVLGLLALMGAVGFAWSSLPEYGTLKTRESLGQVIRVRATDGTILLSLGPIYGEWVEYKDIPPVMIDAMVSVEDRRFRSHFGVDPMAIARSAKVRWDRGRATYS
jgi:penicillin-binding protein 1A